MNTFLEETKIIDFSETNIQNLSKILAKDCKSDIEVAKNCFTLVGIR